MRELAVHFCVVAVALVGMLSGGCSRTDGHSASPIRTVADLRGRRCGVVTGSAMQEVVEAVQQGVEFSSFNDALSMVEALRLGKVDAVPMDTVVLRRWASNRPGELEVVARFGENPYGFFFQRGSPLRERANVVLAKLKASGELQRIVSKWCDAPSLDEVRLEPPSSGAGSAGRNGTLRFVTNSNCEPGVFVRRGEVVGFDVDIARRIAGELGMGFELDDVSESAIVPAVQSGKADMGGGCLTITASRSEVVDFTDCYLDDGFSLLVRASRTAGGIRTAADLKGRHVAHLSSDFHKRELVALQPDVVFDPYSEYSFAFESLRNGKIDAISIGKTYADIWLAKFAGEFRIAFEYADDVCCFLLQKNLPLKPKLDAELRRMNASGELGAIYRKWIEAAKAGVTPDLPRFTPPAGAPEVRVACAAQAEPWCFVANGEIVGVDMEILAVVANRLGLRLKSKAYSWGGMVDCVNARRCEIACGGIYTAGGEFPTVDASERYADEKMCILVRNEAYDGGASGLAQFAKSLKASFVRTFVTEDRWKMLANGFGVTLLITFLSALLGTALAFPVWRARTSHVRLASSCAKAYISVLQGTPVLVLLMVLYYIVFGKTDIDALWVAVIGFGLNLSAYAGEMLRSGVDSVPCGQVEAALALGYTPRRTFFRFVLPQAVRAILPVYRGELIGLLKTTSIVGYIAIGDLTKASDLVRSRTYESFFPIITTALVYFVASWILALALERLGRRLDPAFGRKARE